MDDEIAVFDNDTLVGSFKVTEILTQENQMNNYLTAWSTLQIHDYSIVKGETLNFSLRN